MKSINKEVNWLVKNWKKIPDKFKTSLQNQWGSNSSAQIPGATLEEHIVVILLSRQKPSVEACYDFSEERITVSSTGKVIWGFDSGCSCPSPWCDNYPDCYSCSTNWKEFELNTKEFDEGWADECLATINEIKAAIK